MKTVLLFLFTVALCAFQEPPKPEPKECDPHICRCKGMQDADPYDEYGNLKPSACKTRCVKNACCCPKTPETQR